MRLPTSFWLLWFGQTVNRIGILVPAFLVLYLEQNKLAAATMPIILGLFGAGVVAAGLAGGVIADMVGPRRTIMAAQLACVVTAALLACITNVYLIGLFSLAAGFLSSVDRPAGAGLVSALVPQENFSRAYSTLHMGFNVGASLGPVLSGFLLAAYPPALFILWSASSLLYLILIWALPRDQSALARRDTEPWTFRRIIQGMVEPFRNPVLLTFLGLSFLLACVYLQFESALPLHMLSEGLTPEKIGIVFAVNAVLMVALLPAVPKLTSRMQENTPLVLGSVLVAVGFGLNALAHDLAWFTGALIVWTIGEVIYVPMAATFLARRAPAELTSTYQGSFFFAWNLGLIAGGSLGIVIARTFSFSVLWIAMMILGILVALGFKLMTRIPNYGVVQHESGEEKVTKKLVAEVAKPLNQVSK